MQTLMSTLLDLDLGACRRTARWHARAGIVRFFRRVSFTADGWLYPLIPLAFLVMGADLALGILLEMSLGFLLLIPAFKAAKHAVKRLRPVDGPWGLKQVILPSDAFSFPSGHTSSAFMVAWIGSAQVPGLGPVLFGWAVLVALSRVVLGVHYPSDVLAGSAMGLASGMASALLLAA